MPKLGRRRSPLPDLLRPHRPAPRHRGELLVLLVSSIVSISIRSIIALSITVRRRSAMSLVHLWRPIGSGATTIWLALIPCFDSTYPRDLIRNKSLDSSLIWELRPRWRHHPWPVNKFD
jgi:hypothetical protein